MWRGVASVEDEMDMWMGGDPCDDTVYTGTNDGMGAGVGVCITSNISSTVYGSGGRCESMNLRERRRRWGRCGLPGGRG